MIFISRIYLEPSSIYDTDCQKDSFGVNVG